MPWFVIVVLSMFAGAFFWPAPKLDEPPAKVAPSAFEVSFASGPAASFSACVSVQESTDGVKTLVPCSDN